MIPIESRDNLISLQTKEALEQRCVNTIRFLAAEAVQKANSGHPGMAMGAAPIGFVLWQHFLRFNPNNPKWFNRDRFILSAGHGSAMYYALLHLNGFASVTMADLKCFRQWGSKTPGHPENRKTPGVEATTGCLGQGIANGVGMALAEAHLTERFNVPGCRLVDHHTYVILGDGCQMVGVTSEACSLAGHLGLGKLIALYDENRISIDGPISLTMSDDITKRFESYGWHVQYVEKGDTDLTAIAEGIERAKAVTDKPSLVRIRTTIGYGSPKMQNTADCHGAPLGAAEVQAARDTIGFHEPPFTVSPEVLDYMSQAGDRGRDEEAAWERTFSDYRAKYPKRAAEFEQLISDRFPEGWESSLPTYAYGDKPKATRVFSGECLSAVGKKLTGIMGGSADLAPSNKTLLSYSGTIGKGAWGHRNLHFGVREHAMGAICTGLALHGSGLIPYCGTFLVFSDYMRGAIRIAALSQAGVIFIMTHDSVAVGEDGPTHQPIEHVATLRAIPNLAVIRPADGKETVGAYREAIKSRTRPTILSLTRQNVPHLKRTSPEGVAKGAYVVFGDTDTPDIILIGTGSELHLCVAAAETLSVEGIDVRVVSMPCVELFEEQSREYREEVLPPAVRKRLVVEAGCSFGWHKYFGDEGDSISIDHFGTSAPGDVCLAAFGYTVENVTAEARVLLTTGDR